MQHSRSVDYNLSTHNCQWNLTVKIKYFKKTPSRKIVKDKNRFLTRNQNVPTKPVKKIRKEHNTKVQKE